ncbi:MAG: TonB-dependent receptor plug domain-containing protein [Acidobacteriota bacterium]
MRWMAAVMVLVPGLLGPVALRGAEASPAPAAPAHEEPPEKDQAPPEAEGSREKKPPPALEETMEVAVGRPGSLDVAAFATVLDTEEIASRGEDLASVLRRVPGAHVREFGGVGRTATLSLRSSTAEQVTVLVDGVPQNRALGGPVDLSFIPATQIGQVTVYRGFGPAAAGVGGIGGVVDIRTDRPGDTAESRVDLVAGDLGTTRLSTAVSLRAGPAARMRLGGEWMQSRGDFFFRDTRETLFDPGDDVVRRRQNNGLRSSSLLYRGVWKEAGPGRLSVSTRLQEREQGVPGVGTASSDSARLEEALQETALAWSWRGSRHPLLGVDLLADGFRNRSEFRDLEGDLGRVQDRTTRLTGGGAAILLRGDRARNGWLVRLDLRREAARIRDSESLVPNLGGADRDLLAATAEDVIRIGPLTLAPSLRWESRRDRFIPADDGTLPPPDDDLRTADLSGKIGASLAVTAHCDVRGSLGTFFRNPNLVELFGDRGSVVGNPFLRPERGDAGELGIGCGGKRARQHWSAELVAFGRNVDDLVFFRSVSQGITRADNLEQARIRGAEAWFSWSGPGGWSVTASGTLQDAVDASGGRNDGKPIVHQPRRLGYLGLGWGRRWHGRWEVTFVGENSSDRADTPSQRLPSRVLHDATLSLDLPGGMRLGVDARNLFDRRTVDVARFPLPGRTVFLHLGWRMGGSGG